MIDDLELIERIKNNNDSNALVELSNRHSGIFYDTINKNLPFFSRTNSLDEIKERRDYFAFKAAESYDAEKGAFSTWFSNQIRYACLSARTKEANSIFFETDEEIEQSYYDSNLEKRDLINEISKFVDEKLKPKEKKVFNDRVFRGKSFTVISKELDLTPQAIQAIFAGTREKIKTKFKDASII